MSPEMDAGFLSVVYGDCANALDYPWSCQSVFEDGECDMTWSNVQKDADGNFVNSGGEVVPQSYGFG